MGDCMLSYLPSFCNAFPLRPTPPTPGGPAARWPRHRSHLRLARVARLRCSQPYASCTHALRSVRQSRVTCPSSPEQCSTERLWWTSHLVRLLEHQTCPRRPSAPAHACVPASRHVSACAAVIIRASRGGRQACWPPSWRTGCVPTGDAPRTYGRRFSLEALPPQTLMPSRL